MALNNPFITNGYAGPDYFCDRVDETARLTDLLTNENNVALISPRRIGKTELIHHVFQQEHIKADYHTFLIDIYSTNSVADLVNRFGRAIVEGLRSKGRSAWGRFVQLLASLQSEISFDMNGNPVWSVGLGEIKNPEITLDEIFRYLNEADKPCLVAIDEFQQITNYADHRVEALLRTYVQQSTNAHFVFSGSQRHLMGEMFTSPARPFYQSVTLMNLHPLSMEKYRTFAMQKFLDFGKTLAPDVIDALYARFDGITSYLQRTMNILFLKTARGETCTADRVDEAIRYHLDMAGDTYETLLRQIPEKQRNVFVAIAEEGRATGVLGADFSRKHHLPSASSTSSALKGLLEKDFVTQEAGAWLVYDKFFELWIKERFLR